MQLNVWNNPRRVTAAPLPKHCQRILSSFTLAYSWQDLHLEQERELRILTSYSLGSDGHQSGSAVRYSLQSLAAMMMVSYGQSSSVPRKMAEASPPCSQRQVIWARFESCLVMAVVLFRVWSLMLMKFGGWDRLFIGPRLPKTCGDRLPTINHVKFW
jgi:hypothetical protein